MCESRRGVVMLLQAGDPEISGAIAEGMLAGRAAQRRPVGEAGGGMTEEQRRELARLVKVAIGNTKTPEDYLILCMAAEQEYRTPRRSELSRAAERLLTAWAMMCYRVREYFRWEGSRWREN